MMLSVWSDNVASLFFWITFYVAAGAIDAGAYLMRQEWSPARSRSGG